MTKSKYHSDMFLLPCPNCHSTNIEEGGDDFDGDVICNDCSLVTGVFRGTKSAINAWNHRKYMEHWFFLDPNVSQETYETYFNKWFMDYQI